MRFEFGKNWKSFACNALTPERIQRARNEFFALLSPEELAGRRFLDIGFGQGLGLCFASEAGAQTLGLDIDANNQEALATTATLLTLSETPKTIIGSILDEALVQSLRDDGGFDIVHSWGVLHHTGSMYQALEHASNLVKDGGLFAVAIYQTHWTSPIWKAIKWTYTAGPEWLQRLLIAVLYPVIFIAKWLVTKEDPRKKERGMDFYHDVVDWVGGYPYEYATVDELRAFAVQHGFEEIRFRAAQVPTGCNEFVFQKKRAVGE